MSNLNDWEVRALAAERALHIADATLVSRGHALQSALAEVNWLRTRCEAYKKALQHLLDSGACDFHGGNQMADDNKCPICTAVWAARNALRASGDV